VFDNKATAAMMNTVGSEEEHTVFWYMKSSSQVEFYPQFGEMYYFHLQEQSMTSKQ
jgi:hypothetical protein